MKVNRLCENWITCRSYKYLNQWDNKMELVGILTMKKAMKAVKRERSSSRYLY